MTIHRTWNTIQAIAKLLKYRVMRDADARIMKIGSRNRQNQNTEKLMLPSRWVGLGRHHTCLNCLVTWTLPRAQRSRCFHSPPMSPGSSAHTVACGSNTTLRPAIWVLNVVNVSSASDVVSIRLPMASRLARECSWAPPARHATAPSTFWLRRAAAWAVMYSKPMNRVR